MAAVPLVLFGQKIFGSWVVDYLFAFCFGIAFQYFTIAPMRHLVGRAKGLWTAVKADTLSLTAWQVGMYGWMAIVTFVMFGHELEKTDPVFWFMMQIGHARRIPHQLSGQLVAGVGRASRKRCSSRPGPGKEMTVLSLTVLREETERHRFERQIEDDTRTALSATDRRGAGGRAAAEGSRRGALRRRQPGPVRDRRLELPAGADRRRRPARHRRRRCRRWRRPATFGAPVLSRGGGTSLAGQCCNVAVVMDFSKYLHRVLRHRPRAAARHACSPAACSTTCATRPRQHGLTFGPDPATHNHCTLGGMLGNNSCGIHSLLGAKHGRGLRTADNTHELEILTYDGARLRVGETSPEELERIIRGGGRRGEIYAKLEGVARQVRRRDPQAASRSCRAASPATTSTSCCRRTASTSPARWSARRARWSRSSKRRCTWSRTRRRARCWCSAIRTSTRPATTCMEILPFKPTGLEGMDHLLFECDARRRASKTANLQLLPEGKGFLLVEFGGDSKEDADDQARRCMDVLEEAAESADDEAVRRPGRGGDDLEGPRGRPGRDGLGARPARTPGRAGRTRPCRPRRSATTCATCASCSTSTTTTRRSTATSARAASTAASASTCTPPRASRQYRAFMDEAADLVVQLRRLALRRARRRPGPRRVPAEDVRRRSCMQAFREFKAHLGSRMEDEPRQGDRRLPDRREPAPRAGLQPAAAGRRTSSFPTTSDSFARAALRCVGVGKCRKRGRPGHVPQLHGHARGEALHARPGPPAVRDAERRGADRRLEERGGQGGARPVPGLQGLQGRLPGQRGHGHLQGRVPLALLRGPAAAAPRLRDGLDLLVGAAGLAGCRRWPTSSARRRACATSPSGSAASPSSGSMPPFAPQTFKDWFRRRPVAQPGQAAGDPLGRTRSTTTSIPRSPRPRSRCWKHAGFQVWVPRDVAVLRPAAVRLRHARHGQDVLCARSSTTLRPQIEAGIPVVGLEPSCVAVFRDELINLFPNDEDAKRLHDQSFLLSEFLNKKATDYQPPRLRPQGAGPRPLPSQVGHGHGRRAGAAEEDGARLRDAGARLLRHGRLVRLRGRATITTCRSTAASARCCRRCARPTRDTLIIANGFSCQEQIAQGDGRRPLHLAQVIADGLATEGTAGPAGDDPEADYPAVRTRSVRRERLWQAALIGGAGIDRRAGLRRPEHQGKDHDESETAARGSGRRRRSR